MSTTVIEQQCTTSSWPQALQAAALVCVQGLGFVGAANAVAIASAKRDGAPLFRVLGVDLPNELGRQRAAALNAGLFPFPTTDMALVEAMRAVNAVGNLAAVTDDRVFAQADVIVIDIGLDIAEKGDRPTLKLSQFRAAVTTVGDRMRHNALVLLESTVYPAPASGSSPRCARERLQARGLSCRRGSSSVLLRASHAGRGVPCHPSLTWPGTTQASTTRSADAAEAFLASFISPARKLCRLRNIRAAEMAKVLENTYRAVNIALIDEWERFARRINIDLFEVLEAIRMRPTHQNIRYPGLGVGGYCLSKDPLFGAASAHAIYGLDDVEFPLSLRGVQINDAMPLVSARALQDLFPDGLRGRRILVLGASYREDVGDTRLSPSATLITALLEQGAKVEVADPLVEEFPEADVTLHRCSAARRWLRRGCKLCQRRDPQAPRSRPVGRRCAAADL